jgi:hypothetical protein
MQNYVVPRNCCAWPGFRETVKVGVRCMAYLGRKGELDCMHVVHPHVMGGVKSTAR